MTLEQIENKFKEYYKVDCDLSQFPITEHNLKPQQDKERSKALGEVFTPIHIVDEMIAKIPADPNLLVLDLCCGLGVFGIRWIRYLHNNNPNFQLEDYLINKLHFLDIDELNCDKVRDIFQRCNVFHKDATTLKEIDYVYHVVFSNPPFNKNMDLKILKEIFHIAKEWVIVHPSTWLIDLKHIFKLYMSYREKIQGHLKSVRAFNGNPVFNIQLFVPCVICHIDFQKKHVTDVDYFGDKFLEEDIFEITKFGSKWRPLVRPFFYELKEYIRQNGSLWDLRVPYEEVDWTQLKK
jgi:SAM-dependent methyltransferase